MSQNVKHAQETSLLNDWAPSLGQDLKPWKALGDTSMQVKKFLARL